MGTLVVATLKQCPTLIACGHFKAMSYFMDRNCCGKKMLRGENVARKISQLSQLFLPQQYDFSQFASFSSRNLQSKDSIYQKWIVHLKSMLKKKEYLLLSMMMIIMEDSFLGPLTVVMIQKKKMMKRLKTINFSVLFMWQALILKNMFAETVIRFWFLHSEFLLKSAVEASPSVWIVFRKLWRANYKS